VACRHRRNGRKIDRGVLTDGGVRAAPGFNPHNAVFRQRLHPVEDQRIFLGVDIIGDHRD
jgi:hypothetical protein